MEPRRHDATKRNRRPGAGRPRKVPRTSTRPVDEEIVGEASRLFARQGVAATTMAQVADAAGLQVSSLYYYFRSKDEILERILAEVNRVPLELLAEAVAAHDDPATCLHAFIRSDGAALCRFPFDINEIHSLARSTDSGFSQYWTERRALEEQVESVVRAAVATGSFIEVDARVVALTILANDEAAQSWFRPRGPALLSISESDAHDPDSVGVFLADMAIRALLANPAELVRIRRTTGSTGAERSDDVQETGTRAYFE